MTNTDSADDLLLCRLIDEEYTRHPYYGSRRMAVYLRTQSYSVNRKRVQRLMRLMNIEAIYPRPKTTEACLEHRKFPYLLRNRVIQRPNEVWAADIT